MVGGPGRRFPLSVLLIPLALLLSVAAPAVRAERLPITTYGPAEGLSGTVVQHVTRDSRGFMWMSTRDGLSRFDGERFVVYGVEHGLPNPTINFLLETRGGDYWIATNGGGACRLDPAAPLLPAAKGRAPLFTCYRFGGSMFSNQVNALHEDARGRLWFGTDDGLFRIDAPRAPAPRLIPLDLPGGLTPGVHRFAESPDGALWVGLGWGLIRIAPDGARAHYTVKMTPGGDNVNDLLIDRDGRLWLAHETGIVIMRPLPPARATLSGPTPSEQLADASHARPLQILAERSSTAQPSGLAAPAAPALAMPLADATAPVRLPQQPGEVVWFTLRGVRGANGANSLLQTADGHIWIGTIDSLYELDRARSYFRRHTAAEGLTDTNISGLAEDAAGNLWAATLAGGAMKLTRNGFHSYDTRDGLGDPRVYSLYEDRSGAIVVVSGDWMISRFDGQRFTHQQAPVPHDAAYPWNSPLGFLDSTDRWWIMTSRQVSRLPPGPSVARAAPELVRGNLFVWRMFEDRQGEVWLGLRFDHQSRTLLSWNRAANTFRTWTEADGVPPESVPSAFAEDAAGQLWIGLQNGNFLRLRHGRFTHFPSQHGAGGTITSMTRDRAGRLWAGSNRDGLLCIEYPETAQPLFRTYAKAEGLDGTNIRSVVTDQWGRVYAGNARGVDRLDPATGRVQHYTTRDGLLSGFVNVAFRDREGVLWFGSSKGISRLTPESEERSDPPQIFIGGVRAAGTPHIISHLGQHDVGGLALRPGEGQLQIDFFGLTFGLGESLRYQYRLDGADDRDRWSDATAERTVHYSRLPPRAYRFQVRAVRADGTLSARAATVAFEVMPAFWQRAWFQAIAALAIALAAYAAYRIRVTRLLALERVRSRIAGDLHDDIGATLAQIAVLSEVVQTQIDDQHAPLRAPVARIAQTAREAIASMSDIVWAINPQKDSLHEMVRRMRRFANEVLPARGITFTIAAPEQDVRLGADERRHIYLIFKEALNNVLRHAEADEVTIVLRMAHRRLHLEITDNGRGYTPPKAGSDAESDGHGLISMARRAEALGGVFTIAAKPGKLGTVVTATIPLGRAA
jgi:signal transduction histidine kinase/ligand-binding sensor domain-containing protein